MGKPSAFYQLIVSLCGVILLPASLAMAAAQEKYPAMEGEEARTRPIYRGENFGDLADQVDSPARRTRSEDIPVPPTSHQVLQVPAPSPAKAAENNRSPAPVVAPPVTAAPSSTRAAKVTQREDTRRNIRTPAKPAPAKTAARVAPSPKAAISRGFETVPDPQRDSIAQRLELVERLIRDHGRAYDYRVMTVAQLEKTLAELDAKVEADPLAVTAETAMAPLRAEIPPMPELRAAAPRPDALRDRMESRLRIRDEIRNEPAAPIPAPISPDAVDAEWDF